MTSLIKNAASLGISYFAYSLSLYDGNPSNVFIDKDNTDFYSKTDVPDQWWQVSFSKPVAIKSYLLKTNAAYGAKPKSWVVNASFDNKTWEQVDAVSLNGNIGGNKIPFNLTNTVYCLNFRIILKQNTETTKHTNALLFTFFDCFGEVLKIIKTKKCVVSCNCLNNKGVFYRPAIQGIEITIFNSYN